MQQVLHELCNKAQFNKRSGVRLRRFVITDKEWTLLDHLLQLLDPFLFTTNQISTSTHALVHEIIPYTDVLTWHVDEFTNKENLALCVHVAAKRGCAILDKYYQLTDKSMIYRIAMILHPAHKTDYFVQQEWPREWIEEAST
ncbi:hypothetical protein FKP32DRAFT_1584964 [Trametes sanguinea]|nr:hypothetical protein FKP32DRAFT_1584964 [Trametes sanguinea]